MFSVQSAIFDLGTDLRRSKSAEHEHFGRRQHSHFHPHHVIQNPTGGGKRLKRFMVWLVWMIGGSFSLERKSILRYCSLPWVASPSPTFLLLFFSAFDISQQGDVARLKSCQRGNVWNLVFSSYPPLGRTVGLYVYLNI